MSNGHGPPGNMSALDAEYQIIGELGRGALSVVYLARDRMLGREVAVKVIRSRYLDETEALERFKREARVLARLQHPNVVSIYAARPLPDASIALVMQRARGVTLKEAIRLDGAFGPVRAEQVLRDLAEALAYLHDHGVVHRDLKPDNVCLDEDTGRALVSDLGIAKSEDMRADLTLTGMVIGTPAYMSPEQIDGQPLDGRSDLYSLGLVGYEMLTGRRPWDGENLYQVIYRQKHDELEPLDRVRPDLPRPLREAIERALAKEREQRWPSARDLLAHLGAGTAGPLGGEGSEPPAQATDVAAEPETLTRALKEAATIQYRRARVGAFPATEGRGALDGVEAAAPATVQTANAADTSEATEAAETVEALEVADILEAVGTSSRPQRGRRRAIVAAVVALLLGGSAGVFATMKHGPAMRARAAQAFGALAADPATTNGAARADAAGGMDSAAHASGAQSRFDDALPGSNEDAVYLRTASVTARPATGLDDAPEPSERTAAAWPAPPAAARDGAAPDLAGTPADPRGAVGSPAAELLPLSTGRLHDAADGPLAAGAGLHDRRGAEYLRIPSAQPFTVEWGDTPASAERPPAANVEPQAFAPRRIPPRLRNPAAIASMLTAQYPPILEQAGVADTVLVSIWIDENGQPVESEITEPSMYVLFNEAALEVARAMDFTPAQQNGGSVPVRINIPVRFAPRLPRN